LPNWTDGLVLGTSNASAGDDELRSLMTQLASGISASFAWPGSGGGSIASIGESKLGNARMARSGSLVGGFGNGFLSLNTNHASVHHIGSAVFLLAHPNMVDYGLPPVLGTAAFKWLTQRGTFSLSSVADGTNGTKNTQFTTPYAATPFLQIIVQQSTFSSFFVNVSSITTGGFNSSYTGLVPAPIPSNVTVFWESVGSVVI
jgi:hypothetical protein